MLSFMRAQYTLFQQGFNILDEIDPYMKKLAAQVKMKSVPRKYTCMYSHSLVLLHYYFYYCIYSLHLMNNSSLHWNHNKLLCCLVFIVALILV